MSDISGCSPTVPPLSAEIPLSSDPSCWSLGQPIPDLGEGGVWPPPHSLIRTNWGLGRGGWPAAASGTGIRGSWREESPGGGDRREKGRNPDKQAGGHTEEGPLRVRTPQKEHTAPWPPGREHNGGCTLQDHRRMFGLFWGE